jgi:hypothetical protein
MYQNLSKSGKRKLPKSHPDLRVSLVQTLLGRPHCRTCLVGLRRRKASVDNMASAHAEESLEGLTSAQAAKLLNE